MSFRIVSDYFPSIDTRRKSGDNKTFFWVRLLQKCSRSVLEKMSLEAINDSFSGAEIGHLCCDITQKWRAWGDLNLRPAA